MPYQCDRCGGTFCGEHRLPEAHDCPGLNDWDDPGGVFDSGFDDSVSTTQPREESGLGDRLPNLTGPGGALAYFRGNMTYVFLALMGITFVLQGVVQVIAGPRVHDALFVLKATHPEYVWTWFTSIFAHGGIGHLVGNAIVIFFFGRIVERYVGTKQYTMLFLGAGALAALGQIAIMIAQNPALLGADYVPWAGVVGASGAGLAIMAVLTVLNPDLRVYLYFLIPVPIWVITGFYFLLSIGGVFGIATPLSGQGIADGAHLIGLVIGLWYGNRVKGRRRAPQSLEFGGGGGGRGPGGPGGPGRGRGPF